MKDTALTLQMSHVLCCAVECAALPAPPAVPVAWGADQAGMPAEKVVHRICAPRLQDQRLQGNSGSAKHTKMQWQWVDGQRHLRTTAAVQLLLVLRRAPAIYSECL